MLEKPRIISGQKYVSNYPREISQPACGIGLLTQAIN